MEKPKYYKWVNKQILPCESFIDWALWYENADRIIKRTYVKHVLISTVFLSIDHAFCQETPVLFETLVFKGKFDGVMKRYTTYKDSLKGHEETVKLCQSEFIHLTEKTQNN